MKRLNVNLPQILSDISERSDKLINEIGRAPPKEKEWFEKIREIADQIVSGTYEPRENDEETPDFLEFSADKVPDCLHFIQGGIIKEATRMSSAFPAQHRHHVHKKSLNRKMGSLKSKCRSSCRVSNQASQRGSRSSVNVNVAEASQSTGLDEGQDSGMDRTFVKMESTTPSQLPLTPLVKRKSSKMTLEKEIFHKKLKVAASHASEPPHLVVRTSRFSGGKKLSSLSEATKLSTFGPRISSKKSALELKTAVKAASCKEGVVCENLKKIKDAQSKKIEEKKRLREEKMERIKEKRIKLEIAKSETVKQKIKETDTRSSRAKERTESKRTRSREPKTSTASISTVKAAALSPKKRPVRLGNKKPRIESSDELETPSSESSTKKTPGPLVNKTITKFESSKVSETPVKGKRPPLSKTPKVSETPAKGKRPTPPYKTPKIMETPAKGKRPTPPYKTPNVTETPAKGKRPTPPYKTPNPKETAVPPSKTLVDETPASTKSSETPSSSKRRATPPIKSQPLKVTPTIVKLTAGGQATVVKDASKKVSLKRLPSSPPSAKGSGNTAKKLKSENSVPKVDSPARTVKGKTKPESYDMTPDRSSFTSYDMSEIVSDDDDDTPANQKPIPSWAVGLRLRNALIQQFYNPPNLDELFGTYLEPPNLELIFEVQKKAYHKRTSSAVWNSPGMFK